MTDAPNTEPRVMVIAEPALADAALSARICGLSKSSFLNLDRQGLTPKRVKIGDLSRALWSVAELRAWVAGGCKPRGTE